MTILAIITVIIIAAGIVSWYRHRTRRIMENLNRMLDIAMQGDFTQEHFDESMLSAVESKLAHYLTASATSAKNVQAEKDKIKTLIADISHQTKTPIANILLYTQLLREQPLPEESQPCVDSLESQSRKLQSLIDALVKTSRLESGIIALRPTVGNLTSVIQSAVCQLAPNAEAKGISIVTESADADAVFDSKWTEEAIFNLLDNAVKYTPSGGEVRVSVTSYELFSAVHIRDTGPGISEEEQPKVFQRFYRGMEHQTEEGVGIGLYLVRQIAEGQGGYIKVTSEKIRAVHSPCICPEIEIFQNCKILDRTWKDFCCKVCSVERQYRLFPLEVILCAFWKPKTYARSMAPVIQKSGLWMA